MNETCLSVFQIAEGIKSGGRFSIPPLQRGLVWNAARMEALWDSVLRGIPIGAISIRNNEIFDGQQRTHAISVGLNGGCSKEDEEILWLDLSPNGKKRVRKFYFRTTTLAHPWGYQLNDDEANNHLLEHGEQRDAVEWLRNNGYEWQLKDDVVEKPYPFEFWPWTARLPVPFAVVVNFINEENGDNTWKHFHEFIQEKYSSKNWGRFFLAVNEKVKIDPKYWECIVSAIQRLSQYRVPIVNADTIYDPDDEALYFKRMNVNGKEPETEDVQYSMLKWHLPSLKKLDEMASGFKSPAVLAQLAMLYFKNTKKERKRSEYVTTVSDGSIADFAADKDFAKFIDQELAELMRGADKLLKIGASDGLLPWHRTRMCQRCWQLYMYLMKASVNPEKGIDYAGLALLIRLFANDAKSVVKTLWTSKSVREALQTSLWEGTLRTPIYPEELAYLNSEEIISGRNWFENVLRWSKTEIGQRWNALRKGFDHNSAVVEMLGYSCRKFMSKMFHGYDASDPRWLEQNRPWAHAAQVDADPRDVLGLGVETRGVVAVGGVGELVIRGAVIRVGGDERAKDRVRRGVVQVGVHRPFAVVVDAAEAERRCPRAVDRQADDLRALAARAGDVAQQGERALARISHVGAVRLRHAAVVHEARDQVVVDDAPPRRRGHPRHGGPQAGGAERRRRNS